MTSPRPPRGTGCGSGPTRPRTPAPPSAAPSATTPAARARCATGGPPTTWSRSTWSPGPARASLAGPTRPLIRPARGQRCSRTCAPSSARTWPRSGPSSAGSPGRCRATRSSTCCRRTAPTSPSSCPGPRAPSRSHCRRPSAWSPPRAPPRWRCSATRTWPPPPRPCPRCCRTCRSPSRAWTPGWLTWSASGAARPPCPSCRAAAAGCSPRPRATPSTRPARRRSSSSPTAAAWTAR